MRVNTIAQIYKLSQFAKRIILALQIQYVVSSADCWLKTTSYLVFGEIPGGFTGGGHSSTLGVVFAYKRGQMQYRVVAGLLAALYPIS